MIAMVDYGAGNVRSVENALERLGAEARITADAAVIRAADKVIFPGVGAAGAAMEKLRSTGLDQVLPTLTQPFLGVCLGLQIMCTALEEDATTGLGIFPEAVRRFPGGLKVPHMGWNSIEDLRSPLMEGIAPGSDVYFVHSYYAERGPATIARCRYGLDFSAAIRRDNFFGVQFHPEKSAAPGAKVLENFLAL